MCSGYCKAGLSLCNFPEGPRPFYNPVSMFIHIYKLSHVMRDGRGIDHEGSLHILRNKVNIVLIMDGNPFRLKRSGKLRRSPVIA